MPCLQVQYQNLLDRVSTINEEIGLKDEIHTEFAKNLKNQVTRLEHWFQS